MSVRDTEAKYSTTQIPITLAQCNTPKFQVHFQGFSSFVRFGFNFLHLGFLSFGDGFVLTPAFREEPLFKLTSLVLGKEKKKAAASL